MDDGVNLCMSRGHYTVYHLIDEGIEEMFEQCKKFNVKFMSINIYTKSGRKQYSDSLDSLIKKFNTYKKKFKRKPKFGSFEKMINL